VTAPSTPAPAGPPRAGAARTYAYGADPDQHADLRLPTGEPPTAGFPVAVLVHGGYWRSRWRSDLMDAMAADLTGRGVATWNVEYRRPDAHDWDATTADVAEAMRALAHVDAPLDLRRVVVLGHSAGGQLAVRWAADVAADPRAVVRPLLTVSLAGVLDLVEGERRALSGDAVVAALGGTPADRPDVYRASTPRHRLPLGLPLAVVLARDDDPDLLAIGRDFASSARDAGDDVVVLEQDGDHFTVIDPTSAAWPAIVRLVLDRVG
jgi:acetyl esterase/lipase